MKKTDLQEKKGTPPISKQAAYSKAASHFVESFDVILDVMRTSKNPSDRLDAARTIINKVIPDLKATDLTSDGEKVQGIDLGILLSKVYGSKPTRPTKVPTDS